MFCFKEVLMFFEIIYILTTVKYCSACDQVNCKEIWCGGQPKKEISFYMYENSAINDFVSTMHWQWSSSLTEKWTVYYKERGRQALSGGFILTDRNYITAKLSWKLNSSVLQWTTHYRRPFVAEWNGTICNGNIPMKLESTSKSCLFYLGDVKIIAGKSGRETLNLSSVVINGLSHRFPLNRTTREIEDMGGKPDKETVWNKIKGWFKELFDQSEHDDRGWLTRMNDWMLGFLERVLS